MAHRLNQIIDQSDCENLVISSSWRHLVLNGHMDLLGFQAMLKSHGIKGKVIGVTRSRDADDREPRWCQISDFLKGNEGIERYCIIDDDPSAFGGRPGVLVDGWIGLTDEDVNSAVEVLTRK